MGIELRTIYEKKLIACGSDWRRRQEEKLMFRMVLHHLSVFLKWLVDDGAKNLTEEFSEIKFGEKMRKPCFLEKTKWLCDVKFHLVSPQRVWKSAQRPGIQRSQSARQGQFQPMKRIFRMRWEANWVNGVTLDNPKLRDEKSREDIHPQKT